MTKAEEMRRYDQFVASLPDDSYLRPWLSTIRDLVETDLRNDFIPDRSPRDVYHECQTIREAACADAERIRESGRSESARLIAEAGKQAEAITGLAERQAAETRRSLSRELSDLQRAITNIAA